MKPRTFSDAVIANSGRYNLEHINNVTNAAGRRVWGFLGMEAAVQPEKYSRDNDFLRTYVQSVQEP